jgi:alanine racemase
MTGIPITTICDVVGGQLLGSANSDISHLAIDSRLDYPYEGTMFIALKGARNNGHRHIPEMYDKGCRNFLVEDASDILPDAAVVLVKNSLVALQTLTAWHRSMFNATIVGITGSNGKTIVKEWLNELLASKEHIVRSPASWNSQIGVPLSVWNIDASHSLGIFEAGISRSGEMKTLQKIIKPHIGVFTNIGPAHAEGFDSIAAKAKEKALLFTESENVICCADHEEVVQGLKDAGIEETRWIQWSRKSKAYLRILSEERRSSRTELLVQYEGKAHEIILPFADEASIENAMHCSTVVLSLGLSIDDLKSGLMQLQHLAMRLELLEGVGGSTLVNDTYSNDPASLRVALDRLGAIAGSRKKAVVLSDFVGSGDVSESVYADVAKLVERAHIDSLYLIGSALRSHIKGEHIHTYESADEFIKKMDEEDFSNRAVLVKGARAFRLERIVQRLQEKSHGTRLEVDLTALKHNLDQYRGKLTDNTKLMVMLKAFGYGSGAPEIARLLEFEKVDHFGVAYANEGIQLRQEGINTPILVMNASGVGWEKFHRFDLQPTVHEMGQLRAFVEFERSAKTGMGIHLEFDTGMHRLGFQESDMAELIGLLQEVPDIHIISIFSHLAAADSPQQDAFNTAQISAFERMCDPVMTTIDKRPLRHILNSAGISRHPEYQLDMVRLGIGLYGYDHTMPTGSLHPALSLAAAISQIKTVQTGESVGYNRRFIAEKDSRIAILPLGYADGLRRSLSNGKGIFWINHQRAPIVGMVCMDMTMVDVSEIDCSIGDNAVLFDRTHSLADLCDVLDTIPYEVLCSFSPRIERHYIREA